MKKELSLPKNRFEVFMDVIAHSWRTLLNISLILGLFTLPIILVVIFSRMVGIEILQNIDINNSEELLKAVNEYFSHNVYTILLICPAFLIASFGFAGSFNMMKNLVWQNRVEYFGDLKKAIKGNVGKIITNGILLSLIYALCTFSYLYITFLELNLLEQIILIIISVLVSLVLLIQVFYGYSQMVIYTNSLFNFIKNNFIFTFVKLPRNIGIFLLTLILVPIGLLFTDVVGIVVVYSFYILMGFGVAILLFTLNSHENFDMIINEKNYPQLYKKGMDGK